MKNLNKTMMKTQTTIIMLFMLFGAFTIKAQINIDMGGIHNISPGASVSFYDSGSDRYNYGNNDYYSIDFTTDPGYVLQYTVNDFNCEARYDFLYVNEGRANSSSYIYKWDNDNNPTGSVFTTTREELGFFFDSDGSVNYDGWDIRITSVKSTTPPPPPAGCIATLPQTEALAGASLPSNWAKSITSGDGWRFTGNPGYNASTSSGNNRAQGSFAWIDFSGTDAGAVLETPEWCLGTGATQAEVTFSYFSDVGTYASYFTSGNYNEMNVEEYNGSAWINVATLQIATSGWQSLGPYTLSGYTNAANEKVAKVRFRGESGGNGRDFYNDLLIDDIFIEDKSLAGIWIGATSTNWSTGSNWGDGNVPGALTNVTIPAGTTNRPYVNGNYSCNNLTVASGAYMYMPYNGSGYTLTVGGNVDINGYLGIFYNSTFDANGAFDATGATLYCLGTPKIKFASTVTSLGTFTEASSTVTYDGTSQTVKSDNYYNLVIAGSGTKTLSGNTNWTGTLTVNSTPTFNTSTRTCSSGAMVINGTLAITTGTITNSGSTDINGKLTISTGLFDANGAFDATGGDVDFTSTGILKLGSTVTSLGTLTSNYGTVWYDGASSQTILSDTYNNLSTYNSTKTVGGSVTVNDAFNLESGTVNVGANTFTTNGLSNVDANLTIGTGTYNADGAFDATGGTIDFTGAGKLILSNAATSLGTLDNAMGTVEYDGANSSSVLAGTHASTYSGSTRGYYFTAATSFSVSGLHVPTDATNGVYQSVQIVDFGTSIPAAYPTTGTVFTTLFSSINNSSNSTISCNVNIVAGRTYGVLGVRHTSSGGTPVNSYGSGSTTVTYNGVSHSIRRLVFQSNLGSGAAASGSLMSNGTSSIGRVTLVVSSAQTVVTDNYYNLEIDTDALNSGALNIDGDLTIESGATLDKAATNYNIAGSFANSGTFTTTGGKVMFDGTGAETCDAISNAATSLYISKTSGSVTTTGNSDFDKIYINSGSYIIDGETITNDNYLYVQGGTLKITSGLFHNNTPSTSNMCKLTSGTIDIDGGEFRIGNLSSTWYPDLYMTGGTLDVSGGTLNVSDALYSTSGTVTQTGGIINVGAYTGTGTPSTTAKFYKSGGTLNLTSGNLEIKSQYPASSTYAIQLNSGVTVNANANHKTTLNPGSENLYMDLNGKTLGKMTIAHSGSYSVFAKDNFTLLGNLTVNGGGKLESNSSTGDITLNGGNFINNGTFDLNSSDMTFTGGNNVTCGAITSNGEGTLGMNKTSASNTLTLNGDVELNKLALTSGLIDPSTKTITIRASSPGSVSSYVEGAVIFDCQSVSSEVCLPTGKNGKYRPVFIDPASTSSTTFTAEYIDASHSSVNWAVNPGAAPVGPGVNHIAAGYWWDIERSGTATQAKVGFDWDNTFLGIDDVPSMLIAHWNTTSNQWENIMGSNQATGTASAGSVRSQLINDFSPFGSASGSAGTNPLPVDLLSFNATCSHDIVDVDFTVLSQINNDYFLVERSEDAVNWEVIGNIDGAGNTNTQMDYNFVDMHPLATLGYYRLTQVDFDAKSETFWPVTTECSTNNTGLDISVYPNPILDHFTIEIDLEEYQGDDVYYTILDIRGSIVKEDKISLTRGFNKHEIQIEDLSTGAYMLRFTNTKNHIKEQRIMVK